MNKPAAIYARVSSDRQKENHTIASQTAALIEYAQTHEYSVPSEWIFQDEGYSGAVLVRPGLEALRDLAAEGQIAAALIYSPDRLSRKYAYQILLSEELSRCGVELVFLKAPAGATPEDQLLVQFQGMIAEYERAQIAERCRRGKRHMAQQGGVNVLSGAPYGYRYVKKSDTSAAFYEVMEAEAKVVRMVFEIYMQQRLSIKAIARLLNERQIATRTGKGRWERSTVWGMLRNPAYRGTACYGKTELRPRQRITRPLRQRKGLPSRDSAGHERPRAEWIEVPVPALVSEEIFALAQEQLEKNKRHSPRRTVEPTLLQGMLVCEQCGYALYRSSTRTSKHMLHYYRCLGSDGYRRLRGPVCTNRPIRQDYLDQFVWSEIIRLLEDPELVQAEIDRRRAVARNADPLRKRQEELRREQVRIEKNSERLVTAYQEGLVTLPQLRQRMPALQKQAQAVGSELQSLAMGAVDEAKYLQLAESLGGFRTKLRVRADTLDIAVRQQILRLVVKEVLVGADTITLRHSIPIPQSGPGSNGSPVPPSGVTRSKPSPGYLLRSGSRLTAACERLLALRVRPVGRSLAQESGSGRCHCRPVCRRSGGGLREPSGGGAILGRIPGASGEVRPGIACGEDAADRVRAVRRPQSREAGRGNAGDLYVSGLHTLLWEAPEGWSVHRTARDGEEAAGGQAPNHQDGAETPPARAGRVRGCMASEG
jgi:site-specific DNA recombinase